MLSFLCMAEGTWFRILDELVAKQGAQIEAQVAQLVEFRKLLQMISMKLATIDGKLEQDWRLKNGENN